MADQDLNNNAAPETGGESTKTRKTVRLAPSITPASGLKLPDKNDASTLADPLANRDTDTGNLEVLDDTQTRRTVKLKPLRPQGGAPGIDLSGDNTNTNKSVILKPASESPAADAGNTNTRKSVVLKPASAIPSVDSSNTNTRKSVVLKPAGGIPAADGNTNTRKTVVLKPAGAAAAPEADNAQKAVSLKPASAFNIPQNKPDDSGEFSNGNTIDLPSPTAPAPQVDDSTQANKVNPPETSGINIAPDNDDRTVKIQRPTRLGLKPAAPAVPAAPAPQVDDSTQANKVNPPETSEVNITPANDDRTVKIQRPNRSVLKPVATPIPDADSKSDDLSSRATVVLPSDAATPETVSLDDDDASASSRATVVLPEVDGDASLEESVSLDNANNKTVSLTTQDLTAAAAAAAASDAPAAPPSLIDEESSTVSFDGDDLQNTNDAEDEKVSFDDAEEFSAGNGDKVIFEPTAAEPAKGSPVYFILLLLTLLAITFTATITALDYLGTWENIKYELPAIPGMNKR
jgi:hypothetical protein